MNQTATVAAAPTKPQRGKHRAAKPSPQVTAPISAQVTAVLDWYDRHRRVLPWRAAPGQPRDSYRIWLSEIMLQQTTVKAVAPYFARFLARWPDVNALARAPLDDVLKAWAGLGYYARARNLHACARAVVERHGGQFPHNEADLRALPGIGSYTAAAIAAIAFDAAVLPVDGNIERVITRLGAVAAPLPAAKVEIARLARTLVAPCRSGDLAQAMMDLGATICTPKRPACVLCPLSGGCAARARGDAESFPRRLPKREGALRRGAAFVVRREDGYLLVRTRPPKGLLGGMTEVPTTQWRADFDDANALDGAPLFPAFKAKRAVAWRRVPGAVQHTFTHFPLELAVYRCRVPARTRAPEGMRWVPIEGLADEALPSLMRKVVAHALPAR